MQEWITEDDGSQIFLEPDVGLVAEPDNDSVDLNSDSDGEAFVQLPPLVALDYAIKPSTPEFEAQLTADLEKPVNYYGTQPFKDVLNFDVLGAKGLAQ